MYYEYKKKVIDYFQSVIIANVVYMLIIHSLSTAASDFLVTNLYNCSRQC
jgi:hypothetical protein